MNTLTTLFDRGLTNRDRRNQSIQKHFQHHTEETLMHLKDPLSISIRAIDNAATQMDKYLEKNQQKSIENIVKDFLINEQVDHLAYEIIESEEPNQYIVTLKYDGKTENFSNLTVNLNRKAYKEGYDFTIIAGV